MNIPAHERARLDKLKALADRGATEGERAAARSAMDRIMEKYGYRRKQPEQATTGAARPDTVPDFDNMSFEEMSARAAALCLDLNELLAAMNASVEAFSRDIPDILKAAAENIRGKSGKPPAR